MPIYIWIVCFVIRASLLKIPQIDWALTTKLHLPHHYFKHTFSAIILTQTITLDAIFSSDLTYNLITRTNIIWGSIYQFLSENGVNFHKDHAYAMRCDLSSRKHSQTMLQATIRIIIYSNMHLTRMICCSWYWFYNQIRAMFIESSFHFIILNTFAVCDMCHCGSRSWPLDLSPDIRKRHTHTRTCQPL